MNKNLNNNFDYDPEAEKNNYKALRLPFALCKQNHIEIQDWWTPKDAWEALRSGGIVNDVSEEYKKYIKNLKKASAKRSNLRKKAKEKQLRDPEHNPDYAYEHQEGKIAGVSQGNAMSHKEADNGNVNPNIKKAYNWQTGEGLIGYRTNCQTCVAVYVARRLGYDVEALPNLNNRNVAALSMNTSLAYLDENGNHPTYQQKPKKKKINEWLGDLIQNNEIFSIQFQYSGRNSGHIITAMKNEEGLKYYDPQTNQTYTDLSHYGRIEKVKVMNLTNCSIDSEFCDTIMKPKKKEKDSFGEYNEEDYFKNK